MNFFYRLLSKKGLSSNPLACFLCPDLAAELISCLLKHNEELVDDNRRLRERNRELLSQRLGGRIQAHPAHVVCLWDPEAFPHQVSNLTDAVFDAVDQEADRG
jgi:hypothetical protein